MTVKLFLVVLVVEVVEGSQHNIAILFRRVDRSEPELACDLQGVLEVGGMEQLRRVIFDGVHPR